MSRKKILDRFTDLKVSRQRKHQLRKVALGLCQVCFKDRVTSTYCRLHADRANGRSKRYYRDVVKPRKERENDTK